MSVRTQVGWIFQAHPRTASTAIEAALGGEPSPRHHDWLEPTAGEKTFCVVRNPFDVMVSWWLLNGGGDLTEFIQTYAHSDLEHDGLLFYHAPRCDEVLFYEHLRWDLSRLFKRPIHLKRLNRTPDKKHWKTYYTHEAKLALMERYGAEVEQYGYVWPY